MGWKYLDIGINVEKSAITTGIELISELMQLLACISPTVLGINRLIWRHSNTGMFFVKSFTEQTCSKLYNRSLATEVVDFIWRKRALNSLFCFWLEID